MSRPSPIEGLAARPHGRARIWQQMKIHRQFRPADLAIGAEVRLAHATHYCRCLWRVGLLKRLSHRPVVYVLPKREKEAHAPSIYRALPGDIQVMDRNSGKLLSERRFQALGYS